MFELRYEILLQKSWKGSRKIDMANLSQIKREKMIAFLEKLKEQHNDDQSLIALNQIEKELTGKKYGLVWEAHEEAVNVMLQENIPVFSEDVDKEIVSDLNNNYNFLLEGDNLHSLKLLERTHKGKIDVIYIDPPYNTGNKDFIYGDQYVESVDGYRHSKWISFMNERLSIANRLLTKNGVIMISIDDYEQVNLQLLCNEIFGEDSHVATCIWQRKTGASDAKGIATITEYVLIYCKNKDKAEWNEIFNKNKESYDEKRYRYSDEYESTRGKYYPDNLDRGGLRYSDSLNYAITCPDGTKTWPNGRLEFENDGWTWKWGKEKLEWGIKEGFIEFRKSSTKPSGWAVCYKNYMFVDNEGQPIDRAAPYKNLILNILNASASKEMKEIFDGKVFNNPKPLDLVKFLLGLVKKNDIVLDFFAGSGTTGQAVLELNRDDNGDRKFILCTNNENRICENVTYNRLKTVILGKRTDGSMYSEGISANLKYYKTDFVNKHSTELVDKLLEHVREMIQLQFAISINNKKYVIIEDDEQMDDFENSYHSINGLEAVFINQDVLLSASQERLISEINTYVIPDCYFDFELREAGELW